MQLAQTHAEEIAQLCTNNFVQLHNTWGKHKEVRISLRFLHVTDNLDVILGNSPCYVEMALNCLYWLFYD